MPSEVSYKWSLTLHRVLKLPSYVNYEKIGKQVLVPAAQDLETEHQHQSLTATLPTQHLSGLRVKNR